MLYIYLASALKLHVQPIIIFYIATVYFEVFHTVNSHIALHLFNYTKQLHNIYSLHTFTVFLLHVSVFNHQKGELCVLYLKPPAVTHQLFLVTTILQFYFHIYELTSIETIDTGMWFYLKDTKLSLMIVLSNTETCKRNTVNMCKE